MQGIDLNSSFTQFHGKNLRVPDSTAEEIGLPSPNAVGGGGKIQESIDIATPLKVAHDPDSMDWLETPVGFRDFCELEEHLNLLPKGWKQGEEGALSDRQYYDALQILGEDPRKTFDPVYRTYTFAAILWGKGSGKDFLCSIIQAYICYLLLCMRSPQDYFGFPAGESCDILNVGKKGQQGERVYFSKFRQRLINWKWLRKHYNIIDEGKVLHKAGKDKPLCKLGTKSCEWTDRNVRAFSETPNPEGYEGYNIIFYLCDEISGWVSEKEREVADKVMKVLRTSQTSRNTKSLTGLGMAISYPRQDEETDIMYEFKRESQKPDSRVYWSEARPWEVRPKRLYSGKMFEFNAGTRENTEIIDVPIELKDDFDQKPEDSKAVYLLRPPAVHGQYFEYVDKLDDILKSDRQDLFKVETSLIESQDGKGNVIIYVRKNIVGLNREPDPDVDYVAWIDAADTNCDAALTIAHSEMAVIKEGDSSRDVPIVVIDQSIVWEPDDKNRRIVDIGSMTSACIVSTKYISLSAVWWDQWNSGTGVFDLRQKGILCDKHNLVGSDWEFFKSCAYTGRVVSPDNPQTRKTVNQFKHLRRTRTGNVEPGNSKHKKDIADTWCGCTALLIGNLVSKSFRRGRAPSAITISGSISQGIPASTYSQGLAGSNTNPFASSLSRSGAGLIKDHGSLFGTKSFSASSQRSAPKPKKPGSFKMPRGRTM